MPEFDDFDEMVSKIATNEPLQDGRVAYYRRIGIEDVARLAEALQTNSTITGLVLRGNGLGDEGVVLLTGALCGSKSSTVIHLCLARNNIGDKGAEALAGVLHSSSSSLTTLTLSRNSIGEKGARALANALLFNSSLETLVLNGNNIGPGGAMVVAEGLLENFSVTFLLLGDNRIGNGGAKALALSLLRGNSNLSHIELRGSNGINQELERVLRGLLKINRTARNPREALERKISWVANLQEDDARLLGLERGAEEGQRVRVETEIGWKLMDSEDGAEDEAAVSQALRELHSFPPAVHRRRLFVRLLGSPKHGVRVASSAGKVGGRALYRKASECGAAPRVLMNLLRAHPSLCACRDVENKLYPFMLLATMSEAGVGDVMELLLQSPVLVRSGIGGPAEH